MIKAGRWKEEKLHINCREFENPYTPLSIMNLGVVIIYPRFKLKWADAADGKAECGAFSVCIEGAFGACLLNYLPPLLVATLVAYTRTLTPDKPIIALSFSLPRTLHLFPLRNYF